MALTHFRKANDDMLAMANLGIDMILGGHDHFYSTSFVDQTLVVKGGCDFRFLTKVHSTPTLRCDYQVPNQC